MIATSVVRDCYAGRRMASVMSLAMMVFIAVPVIAPSFGQAVMLLTKWRGIFVVLTIYGVRRAGLDRAADAGDAAAVGAQVARDRRGARLPSARP